MLSGLISSKVSFWLADGLLVTVSSHDLFGTPVSLCLFHLLDHSYYEGPTLMASGKLLQRPFLRMQSPWGLGLPLMEEWRQILRRIRGQGRRPLSCPLPFLERKSTTPGSCANSNLSPNTNRDRNSPLWGRESAGFGKAPSTRAQTALSRQGP